MAEMTGSAEYMANRYVDYQQKYRSDPRESDKVLLSLICRKCGDVKSKTLLDIGCHNGNLLYHIQQALPGLTLQGGDIFSQVIEQCQSDPELDGISFEVMDILDLNCEPVDFLIVNAVLFRFNDHQHLAAWQNIAAALKPGGWVFVFDFYHDFHQTLRIVEETPDHPEGLILTFRSQADVEKLLHLNGFGKIEFYPFRIGIDLSSQNRQSALISYTRTLAGGERLLFRGALCQPWCHLAAQKTMLTQS